MNLSKAKRPGTSPLISGLAMILLVLGGSVHADGGSPKGMTDATPEVKPLREFIYYPNYAQSPYNYQSTGDFAHTPLVIPSSVPVIQQPSHLIVEGPPPMPPLPAVATAPALPQSPAILGTPGLSQPSTALGTLPPSTNGMVLGPNGPSMPPMRGFSLHVGSSMDATHADLLMRQIIDAGVPGYRRPMSFKGLTWEQVHAGPFESHEKVTEVAKLLQERLQIQGRIVAH
ncbi:MAG: hypothetical protein HQL76_05230 [Magnetococcales bacterium]|nr:hypothetical protein [Magnetococcales bacterium]